jgi:hypothetical protein
MGCSKSCYLPATREHLRAALPMVGLSGMLCLDLGVTNHAHNGEVIEKSEVFG